MPNGNCWIGLGGYGKRTEFCKLLGVSRATLRDACKKLDTQGFIERTKTGTFVKCKDAIARQGNYSASLELATTLSSRKPLIWPPRKSTRRDCGAWNHLQHDLEIYAELKKK